MRKFCFIILLVATIPLYPYKAVLFNGQYAQPQDKLLALTLAGIVNRDSARLYLLNVYETWSYSSTDETWLKIYKTTGGAQFDSITNIGTLINRFRSFIAGGVSYDNNQVYSNFSGQTVRWQAEYAALIGSLSNRIPVTPSMASAYSIQLQDSILIHDYFDADPDIYVTGRLESTAHPWNNTALSSEQRYLSLIDWGINNLLPRCNPFRFYIREYTDYTARERMFQVNLAGTGDLHFESLPEARAVRIEQVLSFMHQKNPGKIFHIYGWMMPEPLVQWFSCYGASFHETLLSNLSWHASYPVPDAVYTRASALQPSAVPLENKYYLIFIGSEGDAGNWVLGFQSGAWLSADRGSVPVAWGWNLNMLNELPFVARYYYTTATVNDGFISVISPLGYTYPDLWESDVWNGGIDSTVSLMNKFQVFDIYAYKHYANGLYNTTYRGKNISNSYNFTKYGNFLTQAGAHMAFMFDPQLSNQSSTTSYGSVIFNHKDDTFYGDVSDLAAAASRILTSIRNKPKPAFSIAGYERLRMDNFSGRTDPSSSDISLPRLKQLIALLKADPVAGQDIEVVTPEKFSILLRKKLGLLPVTHTEEKAFSFSLSQNYPNPFNPSTEIRYTLQQAGMVSLVIYDVLGKEIAHLVHEYQQAGEHAAVVQAASYNLSSGVYYYRLSCGSSSLVKKMILLQ